MHKNIRQHALSILTDLFLKKQSSSGQPFVIPLDQLCAVLCDLCIPVAGRRIFQMQHYSDPSLMSSDQLMMEFELCTGLIFKPLRHHIHHIIDCGTVDSSTFEGTVDSSTFEGKKDNLSSMWFSVLSVLENFFGNKSQAQSHNDDTSDDYYSHMSHRIISDELKETMFSLASEHLQSAVVTLLSMGALKAEPTDAEDLFTLKTWESIQRMGISDTEVQQWKQQALIISKNEVASPDK